jgi:hypothetical protein
MRNKRSIRYVSWEVWSVLRRTYPKAIELKIKRRSVDEPEDDDRCQACLADNHNEEHVKSRLADLAQHCLKSPLPQTLRPEELIEVEAPAPSSSQYRLVHQDDMAFWNLFLSSLLARDPSKISEGFNAFTAAFPASSPQKDGFHIFLTDSTDHEPSPSDTSRLRFLSNIFRPMLCTKHRLPISSALKRVSSEGDSAKPNVLSERVSIIEESTYQDFLAKVAAVTSVLFPSSDEPLHIQINRTPGDELSDGAAFSKQWKIGSLHPSFRPAVHKRGPPAPWSFIAASDTMSMCFDLECATCEDDECNKRFKEWQAQEDASRTNGSKGSDTSKSSNKPRMSNAPGAAAHDPIQLDSDIEEDPVPDTFSLRVFEAEGNADEQSALTSLVQCAGLPAGDTTAEEGNVLRRSSRKRKSRYPVGVIKDEKSVRIAMHHNVAAIRLKIFETCDNFNLEHNLKLVISSPSTADKASSGDAKHDTGDNPNRDPAPQVVDLSADSEIETSSEVPVSNELQADACSGEGEKPVKDRGPIIIDLSFDLVTQTLLQVCESSVGGKLGENFNPVDDLMFLHQHTHDESSTIVCDTDLMGYLISISNLIDTTAEPSNKKGRRGVTEKGFTGTFLSSAPKLAPKTDQAKVDCEASNAIAIDIVDKVLITGEGEDRSSKKAKLVKKSDLNQSAGLNGSGHGTNNDQAVVRVHPDSGVLQVDKNTENGHVHNFQSPKGGNVGIRTTANESLSTNKSVQEMLDDESDDDDALLEGGLSTSRPPQSSKATAMSHSTSSPETKLADAAYARSVQQSEKAYARLIDLLLLAVGDAGSDQAELYCNAARWAVDLNPGVDPEDLTDLAYAKFVELTLNIE